MTEEIFEKGKKLQQEITDQIHTLEQLELGLDSEKKHHPKLALQCIDEEYDLFEFHKLPQWITDKYMDGIREDIKSNIKMLETEFEKL